VISSLILKRAPASRSSGQWRDVGRIFVSTQSGRRAAPGCGRAGSADSVKRPAHGYEPTRQAAMAAFAKSWRACSFQRDREAPRHLPGNAGQSTESSDVAGASFERWGYLDRTPLAIVAGCGISADE
jgi:hypothetical protein